MLCVPSVCVCVISMLYLCDVHVVNILDILDVTVVYEVKEMCV